MPKANFYLLKQASPDARRQLACRLAEQQARQGQRVYLHAASADDATALDDDLWSYAAESFLPHGPVNTATVSVWVGHQQIPAGVDCVVNLSGQPLAADCAVAAVAEFVLDEDRDKERGRTLWQEYKQRGWTLGHHVL